MIHNMASFWSLIPFLGFVTYACVAKRSLSNSPNIAESQVVDLHVGGLQSSWKAVQKLTGADWCSADGCHGRAMFVYLALAAEGIPSAPANKFFPFFRAFVSEF